MTTESLLLVGRGSGAVRDLLETHATRLEDRLTVDSVAVTVYEHEPLRELRKEFEAIAAERVYAVPMCAAHTYDTLNEIPAALSYVSGDVRYCDPVGTSPAITDVLAERGDALVPEREDASLVLVGFGSSSKPHNRQTTDYHADRLREQTGYGAVVTCYLLQNPTVECVRYNVPTERAVAVPLFVAPSEATEERIPEALELGRGGIEYAAPLGEHPRVTDAVCGEVERQRALSETGASPTEAPVGQRPVATDGEGPVG